MGRMTLPLLVRKFQNDWSKISLSGKAKTATRLALSFGVVAWLWQEGLHVGLLFRFKQ